MSLFVQHVRVSRRIDDERPWTASAAVGVASILALYFVGKLLCFGLYEMFKGLFLSKTVLNGAIVAFFAVVTGIPVLIAPLVGLWSGRNWAWWFAATTAVGVAVLGFMAHFAVFPDLLAPAAGWLDWFVGYPLPIAAASLVVLALLCSPPTRRWVLLCYRLRSQMPD
jgi:hypothetical protein